jgi:hypothetical protein
VCHLAAIRKGLSVQRVLSDAKSEMAWSTLGTETGLAGTVEASGMEQAIADFTTHPRDRNRALRRRPWQRRGRQERGAAERGSVGGSSTGPGRG